MGEAMAKISMTRGFTMQKDEVRKGMEMIGERLHSEHGMKYSWEGEDRVNFSHKAGKGFLEIRDNAVVLELHLGLLYSAMAPVVKKHLLDFADQYIS
jgi:putative polyhydroxyalkanoate system protein